MSSVPINRLVDARSLVSTLASVMINPLPTNDALMRHDLCELSISLWEFIWGVLINTKRYTSVHGFCFF